MRCHELTLAELMADPVTLAVMAADRVDPAALKAMLSEVAGRLRLTRMTGPMRDHVGQDDRPW